MSLKKVSEEILADAKSKAQKIENEGRDEAKAILTEAKKKEEQIMNAKVKETRAVIAALERKEIASAKIAGKRLLLDAKKDAIARVRQETENRIASMDAATRKKMIDALLKNAMSELADAKRVYVNNKDVAYAKKAARGLEVLEGSMIGGVVVENEDGTIRVDNTFDTLLEKVRKETVKDVSDILFR